MSVVLETEQRQNKNFAVVPFYQCRIGDRYLVSNVLGHWDFLREEEFGVFSSLRCQRGTALFRRLYDGGLLVDERNLADTLQTYRDINNNLFQDTSLHIAVVTSRCNLGCRYCHADTVKKNDMDAAVAARVLHYLFSVKNRCLSLEFQGGEPLLNWETTAFLVENARKFNTMGKDLRLSVVSNLTLLDEEKMEFFIRHRVDICASFDGPRPVHDKNRVFPDGRGTYDIVLEKAKLFKDTFGRKINFMPTITRHSFAYTKEIIDEYLRLGQAHIALRPVSRLGSACACWRQIGYTPEEFIHFYKNALDYILELNKKGVFMVERMAAFILKKVLMKQDPGYTELMSPCGAGRGQIVYMPDGECYPCDEARMLPDEIFRLGNIKTAEYEDMMKQDSLLHLLEASVVHLWDPASVFSPWIGVCPVVNYALQQNLVPKITCSSLYKILTFQFRYIFEKMEESQENVNIFRSWLTKGGYA